MCLVYEERTMLTSREIISKRVDVYSNLIAAEFHRTLKSQHISIVLVVTAQLFEGSLVWRVTQAERQRYTALKPRR